MSSIVGEQAEALADLTGDRRTARYREIVSWCGAVTAWVQSGEREHSDFDVRRFSS